METVGDGQSLEDKTLECSEIMLREEGIGRNWSKGSRIRYWREIG